MYAYKRAEVGVEVVKNRFRLMVIYMYADLFH